MSDGLATTIFASAVLYRANHFRPAICISMQALGLPGSQLRYLAFL